MNRGKTKRGTQKPVDAVLFPPTQGSKTPHLSYAGSHSTHDLQGYSQHDYLNQQNLGQTANTIEYPKTMQEKKDYIAMISNELTVGSAKPEEPNFVTDTEALHYTYQSDPNTSL